MCLVIIKELIISSIICVGLYFFIFKYEFGSLNLKQFIKQCLQSVLCCFYHSYDLCYVLTIDNFANFF